MKRFWVWFFIFWPIAALASCIVAPAWGWWFPSKSYTPLGGQIDDLFYFILVVTTVVFIGTQIGLGYVLWTGARHGEEKALFTHGSHNLEVIWTIVPAGILLFVALIQMNVWAEYRIKGEWDESARLAPIAEVTARQFEWRIRYPAPDRKFRNLQEVSEWLKQPQADDLYTVNDLHVPTGRQVIIHLRTMDVQHSFFVPKLRVKQDAVPGLVIPIMFHITQGDQYELLCAELCGWGHYKMKARVWAQADREFQQYLTDLQREQFDDGVPDSDAETSVAQSH